LFRAGGGQALKQAASVFSYEIVLRRVLVVDTTLSCRQLPLDNGKTSCCGLKWI